MLRTFLGHHCLLLSVTVRYHVWSQVLRTFLGHHWRARTLGRERDAATSKRLLLELHAALLVVGSCSCEARARKLVPRASAPVGVDAGDENGTTLVVYNTDPSTVEVTVWDGRHETVAGLAQPHRWRNATSVRNSSPSVP